MAITLKTKAGMRKRRNSSIDQLSKLPPGQKIVIPYAAKTSFASWIAVQRERLDKDFKWTRKSPTRYEVWVQGEPSAPSETSNPLETMDWYADPLPNVPLVVKTLNLLKFAPRHGKGGGIIKTAQETSGVSAYKARLWAKKLESTKALTNADPSFRRFLAEVVRTLQKSEEVTLANKIYERAKKGKAVQVRLTRQQLGVVLNGLRRTSYTPNSERLDTRKPSLYSITLT